VLSQVNYRWTVLSGLILGAYLFLFLPFWKPLILGFLLACACQPGIRKLRAWWPGHRKGMAWAVWAGLTVVMFGLVVGVFLNAYSLIAELMRDPSSLASLSDRLDQVKSTMVGWLREVPLFRSSSAINQIEQAFGTLLFSGRAAAVSGGRAILMGMPIFLIEIFLFFVAFAAFLMIGPHTVRVLNWFLGNPNEAERRYLDFEDTCLITLGSLFLTAAVQALIVVIGASAAGFTSLMLIFVVTFIFAMIPILGAGIVGVILAVFAFADSNSSGGVILLLTAGIAGIADNIMVAWLFSRAAKTNPAISLISFLGGIALFGFAGLFIAPVLEQLVMKELNPRAHSQRVSEPFADRLRRWKVQIFKARVSNP